MLVIVVLKDYGPVALISIVMKGNEMKPEVSSSLVLYSLH